MTSIFNRLIGRHDRARRPRTPAGVRVYAIGDVHGRDDLLADLLAQIDDDRAARGQADTILVMLGDLIDRGPDSAAVVERLRTFAPQGMRPYYLAGNHEEVLLRLLDGDDRLIADWLRFGGRQCCQSYGIDLADLAPSRLHRAGAVIRAAIPQSHADFLRGFGDTLRVGDYLFVHAGIRPGLPVEHQAQADLRWIRRPFLEDQRDHGFVVVHGHTISDGIDDAVNRVGIDTGAYHSGILTAFCAEGEARWFLQTEARAEAMVKPGGAC